MHSGDVALLYMEYKTDQNLRRMFCEHFYKALKLRRSCLVVSFQGYNVFMGSLAFWYGDRCFSEAWLCKARTIIRFERSRAILNNFYYEIVIRGGPADEPNRGELQNDNFRIVGS